MTLVNEKDLKNMGLALAEAEQAFVAGEIPIGAIVTNKEGKVIGSGHNEVESNNCQLFHAETVAIKQATQNVGNWRLDECTIYTTLEPCEMCRGLIRLSRISKILYGTKSDNFPIGVDIGNAIFLYNWGAPITIGGVKKAESIALLKQFFKKRRIGNE